jgi:hypothetical protein
MQKLNILFQFVSVSYYICIVMSKLSAHERSILSHTTVNIGSVFDVGGVKLACIERPPVATMHAADACIGCYFSKENKTCPPSQCSSFGRLDGRNVWFVRYEDIKDCK